jgi:hypothetical protein
MIPIVPVVTVLTRAPHYHNDIHDHVALPQSNTPGAIVVLRNQPPSIGSVAKIAPPLGVTLPTHCPP